VEALLLSLALLAAGGVLLAGGSRGSRLLAAGCLVVAAGGAWLYEPGGDTALAAAVPAPVTDGGFTSSARCRACHPAEYASWHRSFHRTMTQPATPEAVLGSFDRVLEDRGFTQRLERRGDQFWAEIPDPLWFVDQEPDRAAAPPRIEVRVVMTTGSHHQQKYWVRRPAGSEGHRGLPDNGALVQLPWVWLVDERRWVPSRDSFLTPPSPEPDTPAVWNTACFPCHSVATQPHFDEEEVAFATRSVELGIACEACHGPAAEHVAANASPLRRYGRYLLSGDEGDPTIVNAARLDHGRSVQVCGQCHAFFRPLDMEPWKQTGVAYRAGDDLTKTTVTFQLAHDRADPLLQEELANDPMALEGSFWPDGTIRVTGREYNALLESACFTRGEMTCLSCHSMHAYASPADQLARGGGGDAACLECHEDLVDRIAEHTHHPETSSGSRCMNCHMPYTSYGLLSAVRSHRVDNPRVAASSGGGRPNACNLCHLDRTLEWASGQLSAWYGTPPAELGERDRKVAAGVVWALSGHAAQRAIAAWHMGYEPAREASGREWMGAYLAFLLADPYVAVRRTAERSLETLPGFAGLETDFVAPAAIAARQQQEALARWQRQVAGRPERSGPHLLLDANGAIDVAAFDRLLAERDHRPVRISE
jgi:predicted CXXCH cytochrome family protein